MVGAAAGGGSWVAKEDGRLGGEQGREVGVLGGYSPEFNHKLGGGRDELKILRRERGDN